MTANDVKALVARVNSPTPNISLNKKLQAELLKLHKKDQDTVHRMIDQNKGNSEGTQIVEELRRKNQARLCQILHEYGWPTSQLVGPEGVVAAFSLFENSPSYRFQRDLLPVIVAAVEKNEIDKPRLASLFDRLRLRAGMKQVFGTQASVVNGFLVLDPIEAEAQVDARRAELGLPPLAQYLKMLERNYQTPLIRSPAAPARAADASRSLDSSVLGSLATPESATDIEVLRIDTNLVSLNVSVYSNKLRTMVSNLEQKDFSVLEDGQPQDLSFFAATNVPFDLVLLLDLSGSTISKRNLILKSTQRFVEAARPSDRLAIVTFTTETEVISPLTSDRSRLLASINRIDAVEGGTKVWDAVKFTLDNVIGPKSVERRRAIVLMSDGVDQSFGYLPDYGSAISFSDLLENVRRSDAMIIPIYLDTESEQGSSSFVKTSYENARKTLTLLADESGGLYYKARKISDLNGVYEQVINDLGKVYSLGYKPANEKRDGSWRTVKIQLPGHPELSPRTRPGYYAN